MRNWKVCGALAVFAGLAATAVAQAPAEKTAGRFAPGVQPYVQYDARRIVLAHVRVVDGTGRPAVEDRNVVLEDGRIAAIEPGADVAAAPGTTVLDLRGRTLLPGLVGMHDHLYYIARPNLGPSLHFEAPLVVKGDPSKDIQDIEQVELVFKDGVGYDRERLLASVRGRYGEY